MNFLDEDVRNGAKMHFHREDQPQTVCIVQCLAAILLTRVVE
jgi:hypothetical protein